MRVDTLVLILIYATVLGPKFAFSPCLPHNPEEKYVLIVAGKFLSAFTNWPSPQTRVKSAKSAVNELIVKVVVV